MISWLTIPRSLGPDFRYCRDIARQRSENFPVASWLVPGRIRPHVQAIYAFARTADDFADLPGRSDDERLRQLDDWERRVLQAETGEPDHPIFRALAHTLHVTQLPSYWLRDLLSAFRQDVTCKRYDTLEQLLDYCRRSANPVGRMLLHLFGVDTPETLSCSDAICTGLQLANHLQDLGEDTWNGRPLYLPREEMERFGATEKMILERRFSPAVGGLVLDLVDRTRGCFEEGQPLIRALPWPLNLEVAITWEGGMAILDAIDELGGNTLRHRPRLATHDWLGCIGRGLRQVAWP